MLKIFQARDGNLTAEWKGVLLHSSYSPVKEVRKFLDSRLDPDTRTAIILGDSLGYITREALLMNPGLKIIEISYNPAFSRKLFTLNHLYWEPGQTLKLYQFLSLHLDDLDLIHLSFLIWIPSAKIFPELSEEFSQTINTFLRERKGSLYTTGGFGKRWLKNSLKNYLCLSRVSLLSLSPGKPVFIAASGYSLNKDISLLKKYRSRYSLWALPSSVQFLIHHGIVPDLIIQTDPGFYTRYHLRIPEAHEVPLAMPLSSSVEHSQLDRPVFLFSQNHFFEPFLLNTLGQNFITLPSTGTVAAAALQLGLLSHPSLLVVGGLDLISCDIHEHVNPNGFFSFLHFNSLRTSSALTQAYNRTVLTGRRIDPGWQNQQLRTYSEWLNRFLGDSTSPLYRLNPSVIPLKGVQPVTGEHFSRLLSKMESIKKNKALDFCLMPQDEKRNNIEKILDFFIDSLKQAELTNQIVNQATNPRSLVYSLFTYLSLPQLISLIKVKDHLSAKISSQRFSELSEKTISVLEELKQDYLP